MAALRRGRLATVLFPTALLVKDGETIYAAGGKVKARPPPKIACQTGNRRFASGAFMIADEKQFALDLVDRNRQDLSDWNQIIWPYAETALHEYKSSA